MNRSPVPDPTMAFAPSRSGYTLPVFACAAAIAALRYRHQSQSIASVEVDLIEPAQTVTIPIEQVATLKPDTALAITRSDPGDNLDLTRHTPLWALVESGSSDQETPIHLVGGEGIGRRQTDGQAAIYAYAKKLLLENLGRLLAPGEKIRVTLILPEGRDLAQRTSNEAFGIVEGLSLLGTSGISQPLSAPGQLQEYRQELQQKGMVLDGLVFCIGENGLDFARQLGVDPIRLVKTANWLGPMLAEAGMQKVQAILLFGYHGKLMKLAAGIFHTHHYVADGRLETLTAHCANVGIPTVHLQAIFNCPTADAVLQYLRQLDTETGSCWVERVYGAIADTIDRRACKYIHTHSNHDIRVGTVLFDRQRQVIIRSQTGATLLEQVLLG